MGYYCFVEGGGVPKREQPTLDIAYIEARRLSGLRPGRRVFVMEVIGTIEPATDRTPHESKAPDRAARKKTVGPVGAVSERP